MQNFGLIYRYEIKKIMCGKKAVIAFWLIAVAVLILNLSSIVEYSVGTNGADMTVVDEYGRTRRDYAALFHGIDIRYTDENGEVVEETVDSLKYIQM